jgi:hypothetical protein
VYIYRCIPSSSHAACYTASMPRGKRCAASGMWHIAECAGLCIVNGADDDREDLHELRLPCGAYLDDAFSKDTPAAGVTGLCTAT